MSQAALSWQERIVSLEKTVSRLMAQEVAPREFITMSEACQVARVSRRTLYNWIQSGRLTPAKYTLGGSPRFRAADLFTELGA